VKKAVFTLNIDGNYSPEICALTRPFLEGYARRIGAKFIEITKREFPEWPVVYEKLQIHDLGRDYDWSIYFDSDTLVHPDLFDITEVIGRDTVLQNAQDMAGNRLVYDDYFRRDGRHIGACNWFTVASNWCLDLWKPLDDLTPAEAIQRIHAVRAEQKVGIANEHLIDDFVLSRNIARYGLKHQTFQKLITRLERPSDEYFWHIYTMTEAQKIVAIKETLERWEAVK
jgi:lipopolysaccharide biosynthesis glycosyltransferase